MTPAERYGPMHVGRGKGRGLVGFLGLYRRFVDFVCRRPGRALALLLLACVPAVALTINFFAHVEAGLQELLPRDAPTVKALEQIHARLGSQSHLTIVVQSAVPETNRRFITTLAGRLSARKIPEIRSIQADVKTERAWLKGRAPLLLPAPNFDEVMGEVEAAVAASKADANPLFVSLDEEREPAEKRWAAVRARVEKETAQYDRFKEGFLETRDGKTAVMLIWLVGSEVDMGPSTRLLHAVKQEVDGLRSQFPIHTGKARGPVNPADGDTTLMLVNTSHNLTAFVNLRITGASNWSAGVRYDYAPAEDGIRSGNVVGPTELTELGETLEFELPPFAVTNVILTP